ncbi:MAG TPA: dTMP kinase [Candidatus Omnitrophota bacterium]|jgi:dTMP kinase|nr:dTMP kinase [Candidatus Omnitrophota bacterium]HSA31202.1 dTMP kinase [Candidatus Omnitrophota bacterium]
MKKGLFITFEGSEGSGKSTQIALIETELKKKGLDVLLIREPGGVKISELIRKVLLDVKNTEMNNECEVLLYMAARAQLVGEVIRPALACGKVVLCDRFLDSTIVYQGYGHGMDLKTIQDIGAFSTQKVRPDMTLLFDIETEEGLRRAGQNKDRIEQRSLDYHKRVRSGYLQLAKEDPGRFRVIRVDRGKEEIFQEVKAHIEHCLSQQ